MSCLGLLESCCPAPYPAMTHPPSDSPSSAPESSTPESSTPDITPEITTTAAIDPEPVADSSAPPDRYECKSCGYVYEPNRGDERRKVAPGTRFEDLPEGWRCPVCSVKKTQFINIGPLGKASGFDENLGYGFGVNQLTPGTKNVLIFGSLLVALGLMLSLYGLR